MNHFKVSPFQSITILARKWSKAWLRFFVPHGFQISWEWYVSKRRENFNFFEREIKMAGELILQIGSTQIKKNAMGPSGYQQPPVHSFSFKFSLNIFISSKWHDVSLLNFDTLSVEIYLHWFVNTYYSPIASFVFSWKLTLTIPFNKWGL